VFPQWKGCCQALLLLLLLLLHDRAQLAEDACSATSILQ
jgi:hypothetical protein